MYPKSPNDPVTLPMITIAPLPTLKLAVHLFIRMITAFNPTKMKRTESHSPPNKNIKMD
jgi:hypothetical protein